MIVHAEKRLSRSLYPTDMGEKPLLWGRQGVQQKRQGDRGGELRAGGQRVRPISKERVPAVTREHERGAVATLYTGVAGTVRAAEVDDVTLAATLTASVGVRVHRQRYHVRQFRPIILRPCEMPSLYLRAMGRTLRRKGGRPFVRRESKTSNTRNTMTDISVWEERNVSEIFLSMR